MSGLDELVEKRSRLTEAKEFLREMLRAGPEFVGKIKSEASAAEMAAFDSTTTTKNKAYIREDRQGRQDRQGGDDGRREEIIYTLVEVCGGVWLPSKNSYYYTREDAA